MFHLTLPKTGPLFLSTLANEELELEPGRVIGWTNFSH